MPIFLVLPPMLLATGAVAVYLVGRMRPLLAGFLAAVITGASLLIWLPAILQLPLVAASDSSQLLGRLGARLLQVGELAYQVSFVTLLAFFAALLAAAGRRLNPRLKATSAEPTFAPTAAAATLLAATTLPAIWAASPASLLSSWALLTVAWLVFMWVSDPAPERPARHLARFGALAISLLFLTLAAAAVPLPFGESLEPASWPVSAKVWAGLAAMVMLGALPFHWWRPDGEPAGQSLPAPWAAVLARTAPAAAGAALLVRLQLSEDGPLAFLILMTLLGLLGLMTGALRAWSHVADQRRVAEALAVGLSGLLVLTAAWAGAESVIAESRVLLLAVVGYYLIDVREAVPATPWRLGGLTVAILAALGLPFTSGFAGLTAFYQGLPSGSGLVLILVTVSFLGALGGALVLTVWRRSRWPGKDVAAWSEPGSLVLFCAQLLPVIGLLALPPSNLPSLVPLLAVALGLALAVALARFAGRLTTARAVARRALNVAVESERLVAAGRAFARSLAAAVREAEVILESEAGLVWLMLLMVLVVLAVRLA